MSQATAGVILAEAVIGMFLLGAVFIGALAIGRRVAAPLERAQQRQLDFTADASHELRTPLAVIEAQAALALAEPRDAPWLTAAFGQVALEGRRMRTLVDDLLWLARLDAADEAPGAEPVDLVTLTARAVERFQVIAAGRDQTIEMAGENASAIILAPPEWIDRLLGVLLDNACRYTPAAGRIRVTTSDTQGRVQLTVEDSGPGIPKDQRDRVLARFYRATNTPGTGLGLAIGDAIVRATSGRWHIDDSDLGGARVTISWPRAILDK